MQRATMVSELTCRGVRVIHNAKVSHVTEKQVQLTSGQVLDHDMVGPDCVI